MSLRANGGKSRRRLCSRLARPGFRYCARPRPLDEGRRWPRPTSMVGSSAGMLLCLEWIEGGIRRIPGILEELSSILMRDYRYQVAATSRMQGDRRFRGRISMCRLPDGSLIEDVLR